MGRHSNFPILFEDVKKLSISNLKKCNLLKPNIYKSGIIEWSRNGKSRGTISILVNTKSKKSYIELNYTYNSYKEIQYRIYLVKKTSNLGKGYIYYFCCPKTNKLCRILYGIDGYFYHREAFRKCYYEKQIVSKRYREIEKLYGADFKIDECYEKIYSKNFKKFYAGKPTNKYLSLLKKIKDIEFSSQLYLKTYDKLFQN